MTEWITSSKPYLQPRASGAPDPWKDEAARAGHVGGHRLVLVERQPPPERVRLLLGSEPGTSAVLRRRVVTLDDVLVEIADSWYPMEIADGTSLAENRPIRGGALQALSDLGYIAARHVEEVAVIDTPSSLRDLFAEPVAMELTRTSYTESGKAFEVAVMLMTREMAPGVTRRLRYELRTT